jgi:hypothetical protein
VDAADGLGADDHGSLLDGFMATDARQAWWESQTDGRFLDERRPVFGMLREQSEAALLASDGISKSQQRGASDGKANWHAKRRLPVTAQWAAGDADARRATSFAAAATKGSSRGSTGKSDGGQREREGRGWAGVELAGEEQTGKRRQRPAT